jgi:aldose sugar dehydrogenase
MVAFMGNSTILAAAPGQIQNQGNLGPYSRISLDADLRGLTDPNLRLEVVARGLNHTTAMAFLGNSSNDILVTEQNTGKVTRIIDGKVQQEPLIDVAVANGNGSDGRGLLGMAVVDAFDNQTAATSGNSPEVPATTTYVFLFFTESGGGEDGDDNQGVVPAGNRLYRYELQVDDEGAKLVNPQLLLDLTARPGLRHYGGPILATYEDVNNSKTISIYLMVGNLDYNEKQTNNREDGLPPDGTSGILRVDSEGNPLSDAILVDEEDPDSSMLQYYYAYGIRNSFGMDFDPVTGNLWDTENGPEFGDEINLVEPGFNSGWAEVMGLASAPENEGIDIEEDLVDFDGRGNYSDPEFVWQEPAAPLAIKFFDSTKLGAQYENDLFVGDFNNALLYHFDLNEDRTALALSGELADKVADSPDELDGSGVIFGRFGSELEITDLEVGPDDGYLYVLTLTGTIYRVVPADE